MTRFWLWMFLTFAAVVASWFGLCKLSTAGVACYSTAVALFLHFLFGEEA